MSKTLDNKLVEKFIDNAHAIEQVQEKISQAIATFETELKAKREEETKLKEALKIAMRDNDVKKFENDIVALTYVAPTTRTAIDTTRLKEEKPELWDEYSKTSEVADSIRIKVKQ